MKALVTPVCLSQSNGGGGGDDDDDNDNELSGRSAHTHAQEQKQRVNDWQNNEPLNFNVKQKKREKCTAQQQINK